MIAEKLVWYFIPQKLRNRLHPDYDQLCIIISGLFIAGIMLFILPLPLMFFSPICIYFILLGLVCLSGCFSIKAGVGFRLATSLVFVGCFIIVPYVIVNSGGIFSIYTSTLYGVLLTGWWAGKKFGFFTFAGCIVSFCMLAFYESNLWSNTILAASLLHICLTIFFSVFFYMLKEQNEHARQQVKEQQYLRISELNVAVNERTQQLNNMRQNLATDFHDETGNMLSAITRQAGMLRLKLASNNEVLPIVDHIILNSERLYAASKDFLWGINHESDSPSALFTYLTSFGQLFYNQFDIAFSVSQNPADHTKDFGLLPPLAARHIIFIFKEAMTNVVKHASANEVVLTMDMTANQVIISLYDDGVWKKPEEKQIHNGIKNMLKRSEENGFKLEIITGKGSTIKLTCILQPALSDLQ